MGSDKIPMRNTLVYRPISMSLCLNTFRDGIEMDAEWVCLKTDSPFGDDLT